MNFDKVFCIFFSFDLVENISTKGYKVSFIDHM